MTYENKNIETVVTEPVPTIALDQIDHLGRAGVDQMLAHDIPPVFKVEGAPTHRDVVHQLTVTARRIDPYYQGPNVSSEWIPQVSFTSTHRPEHQDGLHTYPYIQVHTHGGGPDAEVVFSEYEFSGDMMKELRAFAGQDHSRWDNFTEVAHEDLPAALRDIPPSRQWTTLLTEGETIFFRNGINEHDQAAPDRPVRILMHEFASVKDGKQVNDGRLVEVSAVIPITHRPRAPRKGWSRLFGRK